MLSAAAGSFLARAIHPPLGVARSQLLQHQAFESALLTSVVTVLVILLVLGATVLVGRTLVNPLRRLQTDALEIAASNPAFPATHVHRPPVATITPTTLRCRATTPGATSITRHKNGPVKSIEDLCEACASMAELVAGCRAGRVRG